MKAKLGAIVVEGRNKLGDIVFSKNHYGPFTRLRIETPYRDTGRTGAVRDRLELISQAWAALTQNQRQAWNNASPNFSRKDIFGDRRLLSGFNLFGKLNNFLLQLGSAQIDVPPLPVFVEPFKVISLSCSVDPSNVELTYSPAINDTLYRVQVFVSKVISPGITYPHHNFYYLLQMSSANPSPYNFATEYLARPYPPEDSLETLVVGQKIFVKVRVVNIITGQPGLPMWTYAIIE